MEENITNNIDIQSILEKLFEKLLGLEKELNEISNEDNSELSATIQNFLAQYNNNKELNLEILKKFINKLENVDPIETYIGAYSLLEFCKSNNENGIYDQDIKKCNDVISKLIVEVNKLSTKCISAFSKVGYKKRVLNEEIELYRHIIKTLEKFNKSGFLEQEDFEKLCSFIHKKYDYLTDEEKLDLISSIAKTNVATMQNRINLELFKEQNAVRKQVEQEEVDKSLKETEIAKVEQDTKEEKLIEQESTNQDLFENALYQEVYDKACQLINIDIQEEGSIKVIFPLIEKNMTFEQRKSKYNLLSSPIEQIKLIALDLKKNILPLFLENKNDEQIFELIKNLLTQVEELSKDDKKITSKEIVYLEYLKVLNMDEEQKLIKNCEELIINCQKLQQKYNIYHSNFSELLLKIIDTKKYFIDSLEEYFRSQNEEDKKLYKMFYDDLSELYINLLNVYNNIFVQHNSEDLIKKAQEFYKDVPNLKNIIVFIDEDENNVVPIIENDIETEENFNSKTYEAVLKKLSDVLSDDFVATGNHKVKESLNYSLDFLKKYRVKSINNGESRIFYSRFSTNLGQLFDLENIHVIFVYSVRYGKNSSHKPEINYEALNRCYKNRELIDELVKLFNEDFKTLKESERKEKINRVYTYLNKQGLKLGHFIETCEKKKTELEEVKTNG